VLNIVADKTKILISNCYRMNVAAGAAFRVNCATSY
jgi:hypothetical protein